MIEINNLTFFTLDKKLFTGIAKKVLSGENKRIPARRSFGEGGKTVSLAFVSKEEIKKLNKKHRGKNQPTDVLSFGGINEVVICPEIVKEKKEDIRKVFIHGILHLLGYDHKEKKQALAMERLEEKYLKIKN